VDNFYIKNKSDDEWDNLQSKLKEYVKIHEINGWENIFQNEINTETNNPHQNSLVTNINEVKQYDIICENHVQMKNNNPKNDFL